MTRSVRRTFRELLASPRLLLVPGVATPLYARIAAVGARSDPDLVLIARTDAVATEGLDAAIRRSAAYVAAGADVIFIEAPETLAELERIPAAVDAPCLVNVVEGGKTPLVSASEFE